MEIPAPVGTPVQPSAPIARPEPLPPAPRRSGARAAAWLLLFGTVGILGSCFALGAFLGIAIPDRSQRERDTSASGPEVEEPVVGRTPKPPRKPDSRRESHRPPSLVGGWEAEWNTRQDGKRKVFWRFRDDGTGFQNRFSGWDEFRRTEFRWSLAGDVLTVALDGIRETISYRISWVGGDEFLLRSAGVTPLPDGAGSSLRFRRKPEG